MVIELGGLEPLSLRVMHLPRLHISNRSPSQKIVYVCFARGEWQLWDVLVAAVDNMLLSVVSRAIGHSIFPTVVSSSKIQTLLMPPIVNPGVKENLTRGNGFVGFVVTGPFYPQNFLSSRVSITSTNSNCLAIR